MPTLEDPQRLEDLPVHLPSFRRKRLRHPLVDLNEVQHNSAGDPNSLEGFTTTSGTPISMNTR